MLLILQQMTLLVPALLAGGSQVTSSVCCQSCSLHKSLYLYHNKIFGFVSSEQQPTNDEQMSSVNLSSISQWYYYYWLT